MSCDLASSSSVARFSVRSRVILAKPISSPLGERMASIMACTQSWVPSFLIRQRPVRQSRRAVFRRKERRVVPADYFLLRIALERARPGVPARHQSVWRKHVNAIIGDGIKEQTVRVGGSGHGQIRIHITPGTVARNARLPKPFRHLETFRNFWEGASRIWLSGC
jgi:hypothetical protein